jgi:diacylglycerol kinase family enzyme
VRVASVALTVLALAGLIGVLLSGQGHGLLLVALVVIVAVSVSASRFALSRDVSTLKRSPVAGVPVSPASRGALIVNPRSGDGKAARTGLVEEAARRGISTVLLEPGSDLRALAERAVLDGADVIGVAGGDGSQALVASVAMQHDVPVVCVPGGTRNHFALDLGLDRDDVIGALDAFGDAVERLVDLAVVGDRVFVNNASLGVYARIVQSPEYREAKLRTAGSMLPKLEGPGAGSLGLAFTAPDGREVTTADVIEVSNNPYLVHRLGGFGSRASVCAGVLGVVTLEIRSAGELARLLAAEAAGRGERFRGWREWTTETFDIRADQPVPVGIDGEALTLEPPLQFRTLPQALRVRIPTHAPGLSPAARALGSPSWTLRALVRVAAGYPATSVPEPPETGSSNGRYTGNG